MYCVKCRQQTKDDGNQEYITTKNGKKMAKVKCNDCGIFKHKFVKNDEATEAKKTAKTTKPTKAKPDTIKKTSSDIDLAELFTKTRELLEDSDSDSMEDPDSDIEVCKTCGRAK